MGRLTQFLAVVGDVPLAERSGVDLQIVRDQFNKNFKN